MRLEVLLKQCFGFSDYGSNFLFEVLDDGRDIDRVLVVVGVVLRVIDSSVHVV